MHYKVLLFYNIDRFYIPLKVTWTNGANSQSPIGALPYLLCKNHYDMSMPSNWEKLINQVSKPKYKNKRKSEVKKRKNKSDISSSEEDEYFAAIVY